MLHAWVAAHAFQTSRADRVEYSLAVLEEFNIPETDNPKPLFVQILLAPLVRFFVANVSVAVEFNNETCNGTVEVGEVKAYRLLTAKSEARASAVTKESPHQAFGGRGFLPHFPGKRDQPLVVVHRRSPHFFSTVSKSAVVAQPLAAMEMN
jgi:hypothetical protein